MKKFLIASVATAALVVAAPAFAQSVTGQVGVNTGTVTQPATEAVEQTTEQASNTPRAATAPQTVTGEASAATETPMTTAQADTSATVTTPNAAPAVNAATETTEEAELAASAEARTSTQVAAAPTGASATTETAAAAAAGLPQPVQVAVADGRYSTDDLNRAQLEALRAGAGR